jgi:hypothetical protein
MTRKDRTNMGHKPRYPKMRLGVGNMFSDRQKEG